MHLLFFKIPEWESFSQCWLADLLLNKNEHTNKTSDTSPQGAFPACEEYDL